MHYIFNFLIQYFFQNDSRMDLVRPFANAAVFPYLPTKGASTINKTISINGNYHGL